MTTPTAAAILDRLQALRVPASLDQLIGLPTPPQPFGWARDGVWEDPDGPWPGDIRDASVITIWTPTCGDCHGGTRAVAAVIIPDPPDGDVEVHAWLLDDDTVLHTTIEAWQLHDPQPGIETIHRFQRELADAWTPTALVHAMIDKLDG